jgi:hypothetical protein
VWRRHVWLVATLLNQVVGAKNHLRLLVWLLMGSILFFGILCIFWHSLLAHLFELQLGLGRA